MQHFRKAQAKRRNALPAENARPRVRRTADSELMKEVKTAFRWSMVWTKKVRIRLKQK